MATKYYPTCGCFTRRVILGLVAPYNEQCPAICGTDIDIIGLSNSFTVDGWYLEYDAPNIVYMESGIITETVECPSRLADYGHPNGINSGYEAPHVFADDFWTPVSEVTLINTGGTSNEIRVYVNSNYTVGSSLLVEYSLDGGATWLELGSSTEFNDPTQFPFDLGTNIFIYRTILTLADGCQYYNPAPDTGSPSYAIYYATIDMSADVLFTLLGTINGITPLDPIPQAQVDILLTMVDPYQTVAGRIGGIGVDFSQLDGGGGWEVPFYLQIISPIGSVPTELAVILDSSGTPVDTSVQGTATVIKNYVATYTFVEPEVTFVEGFEIFGATVRYNQIGITNPDVQQEVELVMQDYQLADPAFSFYVEVNPTNVQVFVTTAIPVESILFDETGVGSTVVPLIEI